MVNFSFRLFDIFFVVVGINCIRFKVLMGLVVVIINLFFCCVMVSVILVLIGSFMVVILCIGK